MFSVSDACLVPRMARLLPCLLLLALCRAEYDIGRNIEEDIAMQSNFQNNHDPTQLFHFYLKNFKQKIRSSHLVTT